MTKKELIIDAHSHLGYCRNWRAATIHEYLDLMESENVDIGFLFPVPWELDFETKTQLYLNWRYEAGKTVYFSSIYTDFVNPYREINSHISQIVHAYKGKRELFFIPMIHPYLDTPEQIEEYKQIYDPVAFKIHGTGSGIEPQKIPADVISALKRCDIPLILHTDYSRTKLDPVLCSNTPLSWAQWLVKHELHGCLAHGARLDGRTLDLVNRYDNIVLGIAPCYRVAGNIDRLQATLTSNDPITYLTYLKDHTDNRRILFDLDFSWNVDYQTGIPVCHTAELVRRVFKESAEDIFSKNCIRFFAQLQHQSQIIQNDYLTTL